MRQLDAKKRPSLTTDKATGVRSTLQLVVMSHHHFSILGEVDIQL